MSVACGILSFLCSAGQSLANDAANSVLSVIGDAVTTAYKWVIGESLTLWTDVPTPGANSGPTTFLQQNTLIIVAFVGIIGMLIAAVRLALQRKPDAAITAARGLINLAMVTGGGITVITVGAAAGDAYSNWIINLAMNNNAGGPSAVKAGEGLATVATILVVPGLPVFLLIVFGLIGLLVSIIQIFLLIVRIGMLGLLAGLLPIAAAASTFESGKAWFYKFCGWILAFLLYKPVAATIFAYALLPLTSNSFVEQLVGMVMLMVSVVALPALMRMVTPMVQAAVGSGSGGAAAFGTALAVALGARGIGGGGGGGRGSGNSSPDGSALAGAGKQAAAGQSTAAAAAPAAAAFPPAAAALGVKEGFDKVKGAVIGAAQTASDLGSSQAEAGASGSTAPPLPAHSAGGSRPAPPLPADSVGGSRPVPPLPADTVGGSKGPRGSK